MPTFTSLRIQKDLAELVLPEWITLEKIDEEDRKIGITITAPEGPFMGKRLPFIFLIPSLYPFKEPRIIFTGGHIFHPNIDYTSGSVCMDILRLEWRPVFSINVLLQGLLCLLIDMQSMAVTDEPLNKEASKAIEDGVYEELLLLTMQGGSASTGGRVYSKL